MKKLLATNEGLTGLILRMTLGIIFFPHGAQKLLGWFGGHGFSGTMGFFTQQGMPWVVAFLVIIGESVGSLGLIFGFLTRMAAAGIFVIMLGAVCMVHWPNGFFMNWYGQQSGEGFEFHLLAIGIAAALIVTGGGKWSLDNFLSKRLR